MQRVSSYLKMRVLGAIEAAPVSRIRHVSEQAFLDEDGRRFQFTWRTIQTWYSRYKKDGTTTVLPKTRSDKGKTRKMTPEEVLEAIEQVRGQFRGTHNVTAFYRACIEKGLLERARIARTPSGAWSKRTSCSSPTRRSRANGAWPSPRRTRTSWQADTMVGPYVQAGAGKTQAKLIAFLDDASRVVCHGEFFLSDNTEALLKSFKTALYKRGICECLYVDNGSPSAARGWEGTCGSFPPRLSFATGVSASRDVDCFTNARRSPSRTVAHPVHSLVNKPPSGSPTERVYREPERRLDGRGRRRGARLLMSSPTPMAIAPKPVSVTSTGLVQ
jgi:hypothetical protein